MNNKKYKILGIRISAALHSELFEAIKKQEKILGRNISAAEVIVPELKRFIMSTKVN